MRRGAAWAAQPGQISLDVERIAELRRAVLRSCEPRRARRCVGTGGEDDEQAAAHRDSVSGLLFLLEVTEELAALDATVVEENRLVLAPALRTGERLHLDGLGADAAAVHLEVRLENEARRPAGAALALTLALALLRLRHRPIAVPAVARHGPILSPDQRTGSARAATPSAVPGSRWTEWYTSANARAGSGAMPAAVSANTAAASSTPSCPGVDGRRMATLIARRIVARIAGGTSTPTACRQRPTSSRSIASDSSDQNRLAIHERRACTARSASRNLPATPGALRGSAASRTTAAAAAPPAIPRGRRCVPGRSAQAPERSPRLIASIPFSASCAAISGPAG